MYSYVEGGGEGGDDGGEGVGFLPRLKMRTIGAMTRFAIHGVAQTENIIRKGNNALTIAYATAP